MVILVAGLESDIDLLLGQVSQMSTSLWDILLTYIYACIGDCHLIMACVELCNTLGKLGNCS